LEARGGKKIDKLGTFSKKKRSERGEERLSQSRLRIETTSWKAPTVIEDSVRNDGRKPARRGGFRYCSGRMIQKRRERGWSQKSDKRKTCKG